MKALRVDEHKLDILIMNCLKGLCVYIPNHMILCDYVAHLIIKELFIAAGKFPLLPW